MAQRRLREQNLIIRAHMEGQEKERQVISAELHDSINQQLSTAKIYLDYAKANENERDELIGRSADVVTRAIQEIRALCYSLTPVGLKDMGLEEAVEDLCLSYSSVGKLKTEYHYGLGGISLTEDLQFVIYRVIQEQMNNIARHAEAEFVRIEMDYEAGNIIVLISDDGKGFDLVTVKEGLGFANMRNRLSVYKGKLEVDTAPGQGCRLLVKIPRK
ncbi:MAG: sensor histidine kinase [Chitinophagaceae bacterium]|nr:sensor histidine kinase [Chitinophagaceae bacterium]